MNKKWCKWCRVQIDLDDEPDHFDQEDWCVDNWNKQTVYAEHLIKQHKIDRRTGQMDPRWPDPDIGK